MDQGRGGNRQTVLGKHPTAKSDSHQALFVPVTELIGAIRDHRWNHVVAQNQEICSRDWKSVLKSKVLFKNVFNWGCKSIFYEKTTCSWNGKGSMLKDILARRKAHTRVWVFWIPCKLSAPSDCGGVFWSCSPPQSRIPSLATIPEVMVWLWHFNQETKYRVSEWKFSVETRDHTGIGMLISMRFTEVSETLIDTNLTQTPKYFICLFLFTSSPIQSWGKS